MLKTFMLECFLEQKSAVEVKEYPKQRRDENFFVTKAVTDREVKLTQIKDYHPCSAQEEQPNKNDSM